MRIRPYMGYAVAGLCAGAVTDIGNGSLQNTALLAGFSGGFHMELGIAQTKAKGIPNPILCKGLKIPVAHIDIFLIVVAA